jgi:hypothetical protein
MPDLAWWLEHFEQSAFRLETLPEYNVPQEAEMLAAFKRGEPIGLPDDHPWLVKVRRHIRSGKLMRRVRLISHPLSDYLRMEMSWYPKSVEAGEDIRIASLDDHRELTACEQDFWLFDESVVVTLRYDAEGRFLGTDTPSSCERYLKQRDLALAHSMELSAYTARASSR